MFAGTLASKRRRLHTSNLDIVALEQESLEPGQRLFVLDALVDGGGTGDRLPQ
jgi:hypothetical protein